MKRFSLLLLLCALVQTLFAQTDSYQYTYGGIKKDINYAIIESHGEGMISVGYTESFGAGNFDVYVVKYDKTGGIEWSKTYGGAREDYGRHIIKTEDNGYLLLGYTNSYAEGNFFDVLLIKIDANGVILWSKTYGVDKSEYGYKIERAHDGGYVILGEIINMINNDKNSDVLLVKVSEKGDFEWSRIYGGIQTDYLYSIHQTKDGGYIMGGETNSFGAGEWDFYIVKVDGEGNLKWDKVYGGLKSDYGRFALPANDGGYLLGGNSFGYGQGDMDFCLLKLDENGVLEWSKSYGELMTEYMLDMIPAGPDGYLISGYSNSFDTKVEDVWIMNISNKGKLNWSKIFGGDYGDYGVSILLSKDNYVCVSGNTKSFDVSSDDCFLFTFPLEPTRELCNQALVVPTINSFLDVKVSKGSYMLESHVLVADAPIIEAKATTAEQRLCLGKKR
jgi:hypothetical protein